MLHKLTVEDTHNALATLRARHKARSARLPNGWHLWLWYNVNRKRWEIEMEVGGVYRYVWLARPEYLECKHGRCSYGSGDSFIIKPDLLDAMAAKLFARLEAIEADYLPRFRLFKSWPIERVRYRTLTDNDIVDVSGWQISFPNQGWYVLACTVERDDIPALIERCEAIGRDRFLSTDVDRGLTLDEINRAEVE